MFNSVLTIYTIIFLILWIIEMNLLLGFKWKYLLLEIIGAVLLYFPVIMIFAGIIHPLVKTIWKDDIGMLVLLDNIPNYILLYLNIKIMKKNNNKKGK